MEQSTMTKLLMNARESNPTTLDIGQTRWRRTSSMLRIGQLTNGYQFWQRVEDRRKGFNIAWIRKILIDSCTFRAQSTLHCKTMYCYQKDLPSTFITSETEENWGQQWSMVCFQGESVSKTGRQAVFVTVVNPMDNQDGLGKPYATCHKQEWRRTKILGNTFRIQYVGAIWSSPNAVILYDTLSAEFLRKRYAWRLRSIFIQGKVRFWDRVLFLKLLRKVVHKIYHLGNRNKMRRATGNAKQHCWLQSTWYVDLNGETAGCTATK